MPSFLQHQAPNSIIAQAERTAFTRAELTQLAETINPNEVEHEFASAVSIDTPATVLGCALALRGTQLESYTVAQLVPQLDNIELVAPLVLATDRALVTTVMAILEAGTTSWQREALLLMLAADALGDRPAPPGLISHARTLARKPLDFESMRILGAAAIRLGDPHLDLIAAEHIRLARFHGAEDKLRNHFYRPLLEVLPRTAPAFHISAGTLKHAAVGPKRNDPCPCGSGKKYKKCCADRPTERATKKPEVDPRTLTNRQVEDFRPHELARLDLSKLGSVPLIAAFRRLVHFAHWDDAERALQEIARRPKFRGDSATDDFRLELIDEALRKGALEVARAHFDGMSVDPEEDARLRVRFACLERSPDLLDTLETAAREAMARDDQTASIELAYTLLRHFPALGIFFARGTLSEDRLLDSQVLLEVMEEARDRLLISPFEPWWEIFDVLLASEQSQRKQLIDRQEDEALRDELRRVRGESKRAADEIAKLNRELASLDKRQQADAASQEATPHNKRPVAPTLDPDERAQVEAERARLRQKVQDLQRIVSQGQEERRNLRAQIASSVGKGMRADEVREATTTPEPDDDVEAAKEPVASTRRVLVPAFTTQASKELRSLGRETAATALRVIAELAAGSPNAWNDVKKLKRAPHIASARAGIHHRVLFHVEEDVLHVAHVVPRRELEQLVSRL